MQLDVWVPATPTPPPLVVWIHGGAWMIGDRRYLPETLRPNQLFEELMAAGLAVYVEREVDPKDARARLVRIAARGAEVIPIARAEEARIEAEWTEHLGEQRMAQMREALNLLRELTDPYQTPTY